MIYICLEEVVQKSLEDLGIFKTIRFLGYKYWTSCLLYAIDHIDRSRETNGFSKGQDLKSIKEYCAVHCQLPKYYAIRDKRELELFEDLLKDGMYVKYTVEQEGHPDRGLLKNYEIN